MKELLAALVGPDRRDSLLADVAVPAELARTSGTPGWYSRAELAMALGLLLFDDLLSRVPGAARYVAYQREHGRQIVLDHGAVRTVDWTETGRLPRGAELFRRVLIPLGYREVGRYPMPGISMTGRAFAHADLPERLPQYFVSELHVERLPAVARDAVTRTVGNSVDPIGNALGLVNELAGRATLPEDDAARLVRALARCFGRHHPEPSLADYTELLEHSSEMAWIATEGNAFNHATDRVPDVEALADELRSGWPVKDTVEHSRSGRIRQTALRADPVQRSFRADDGTSVSREVPGSFFEFISRGTLRDGSLDLAFDAGNAQGIFRMTEGARVSR
jgi:hypothetical protein